VNPAGNATIFAALILSLVTGLGWADVRTWTDSTGTYQVQAELVDEDGGTVRLRKRDGQIVSLPLERLSTADQAYIRSQRTGQEQPAGAPDLLAPSSQRVTLELLTGAQVTGRILASDDQSVTLETVIGGRKFMRKYPLDRLLAVVKDEQRTVLNESASSGASATRNSPPGGPARSTTTAEANRSRAEIESLIEDMGRTPPDWWETTPLSYPQSLDLAWPEKPPGNWDNQKNVGQYLWDVIYPNPNKWREGIRFVHFLLERHQEDAAKTERNMLTLGRLYYLLLQDHARAAFWWRKAGVERGPNRPESVYLADCYWRLGSKPMALDYLKRMSRSAVPISAIKQLADMGETRSALQLAEVAARGGYADQAYLYAGDACRIEGQFEQAIGYYDKVLKIEPRGKEGEVNRIRRAQTRARTNVEAIRVFDRLDLTRIPDGKYRGAAPAYGGTLEVEVAVQDGRLLEVRVIRHEEKQYYAAMDETPKRILEKQGLAGVDATSGATITSEAIINATAKALSSAL
jgi:uncharacterized protein with FMN-binding domain